MEDVRVEMSRLRSRMRLQSLVLFGALAVTLMAMGGADVVAVGALQMAGVKLSTENASSQLTERLEITAGQNIASINVKNANIVLDSNLDGGAAEGSIGYDTTEHTLKVKDNTGWVGVGSGGNLTLVERKTLSATQTTVTFNNLNGDQDGTYFIDMRVKSGSGGRDAFSLRPNGLTTNQNSRYQSWYYWGYVSGGNGAMTLNTYSIYMSPTQYHNIQVWFHARSTVGGVTLRRTYNSQFGSYGSGTYHTEYGNTSGYWDPGSAVNVTSLVLSGNSNAFGAGTEISLYRVD